MPVLAIASHRKLLPLRPEPAMKIVIDGATQSALGRNLGLAAEPEADIANHLGNRPVALHVRWTSVGHDIFGNRAGYQRASPNKRIPTYFDSAENSTPAADATTLPKDGCV